MVGKSLGRSALAKSGSGFMCIKEGGWNLTPLNTVCAGKDDRVLWMPLAKSEARVELSNKLPPWPSVAHPRNVSIFNSENVDQLILIN